MSIDDVNRKTSQIYLEKVGVTQTKCSFNVIWRRQWSKISQFKNMIKDIPWLCDHEVMVKFYLNGMFICLGNGC